MSASEGLGIVVGIVLGVLAVGGGAAWFVWDANRRRDRQIAYKRQLDAAHQHAEAGRHARWAYLVQRYGQDAAQAIVGQRLFQGATHEMIVDMLGHPADVDEQVMKTKTKRILKYAQTGANRFALRVTLEDGVVVGWDDKR